MQSGKLLVRNKSLYMATGFVFFLLMVSCRSDLFEWPLLRSLSSQIDQFDRRLKITIDNSGISETLADFPVLVLLDSSRVDTTRIGATVPKIRFYSSDLSEVLAYEVETWDPAGTSVLWVKVPSITAGSTTDHFWLYYDFRLDQPNPSPTDVWSNGYVGVWHLGEDTAGTYRDSSGFYNTGGIVGETVTFDSPDPVAGKIGRAQDFTSLSDGIAIPPILPYSLGPLTIEFWFYGHDLTNYSRLYNKGNAAQKGLDLRVRSTKFTVEYGTVPTNTSMDLNVASAVDTWYWMAIRWNGVRNDNSVDNRTNYRNAASLWGSTGGTYQDCDYGGDESAYLYIGNANWGGNGFNGIIDEFRVSNVQRSQAWIQAQYRSMTDAYLSYGPEETLY